LRCSRPVPHTPVRERDRGSRRRSVSGVRRVFVTGMSGTGKSSALRALGHRGFHVVDTDEPSWSAWSEAENGYVWNEARIVELLAVSPQVPQFVSGAVSNQGRFYPYFDEVVLLSAPAEVLLERLARRSTNDFGKTEVQRARILRDLSEAEPRMRRTCTVEIDATQPLAIIVDQLAQLSLSPSAHRARV
jgi:dephospho-CoA kinase